MKNIIMVPLRLDGLYLEETASVLSPMIDFTRLPYLDSNGTRHNGGQPYISENITSNPFDAPGLTLSKGVHLHWAIPDALTRGVSGQDKSVAFPVVPNHWLITRSKNNKGGYEIDKQWVVESDRLFHPDTDSDKSNKITILYSDPDSDNNMPFRYMGNAVILDDWKESNEDSFDNLTAIGYGDPIFGAFYPHCRSVFGFNDTSDDLTKDNISKYKYEIIGWYSDTQNDYCTKIISQLTQENPDFTKQDFLDTLQQEANWTVKLGDSDAVPELIAPYAQIEFDPSDSDNIPEDLDVDIAVGNTPMEALSAYAASKVDPDNKAQIEDYLEAVELSKALQQKIVDTGYKFEEERHCVGFSPSSIDSFWSVKVHNINTTKADALNDQFPKDAIELPNTLIQALDDLNKKQQEYDQSLEKIKSLRRQSFSGWYKYQLCKYHPSSENDQYPDASDVGNYISESITVINSLTENTGTITIQKNEGTSNVISASGDENNDSLASQLAVLINNVLDIITPIISENKYETLLFQEPAGRYWQPNEPAIILAGKSAQITQRHGQNSLAGGGEDNSLECQTASINNESIFDSKDEILNEIINIKKNDTAGLNFAFSTWQGNPWNPFLIQWEIEFYHVKSSFDGNNYKPSFITDDFELIPDTPKLSFQWKPNDILDTSESFLYSGSSILTPHVGKQLILQMNQYLSEQLLDIYCNAQDPVVPCDERNDKYYQDNKDDIISWYQENNPQQEDNLHIYSILNAHKLLSDESFGCLSQVLSGFNPALIMQKQTFQLNIDDPLQNQSEKNFTKAVKAAVDNENQTAPLPENALNPIRAGGFKINRLRIVDTFGRYIDFDKDKSKLKNFIFSETLSLIGLDSVAYFPPRLSQPAKIDVSLLSAESNDMKMNSHLGTTPVCGWILPNNLDQSIMIYDKNGNALGSLVFLDANVKWQKAPQSKTGLDSADDISNSHLKKMVKYIMNPKDNVDKKDFFNKFLSVIEISAENIAPDNYAQYKSLALLMGRPLALVRTSLKFELYGDPCIDQGWYAFMTEMNNGDDSDQTLGFTKVKFPVRVGEFKQLNDGVVGYWKEDASGDYEDNTFYTVQDDTIEHDCIKQNTQNGSLALSIDSEVKFLSMLVDPRAKIHVTTGILPVKTLVIPGKYYSDTLNGIEVTFLTAPVLSDSSGISIPLFQEPGSTLSWLEKSGDYWAELLRGKTISKSVFNAVFKDQSMVASIWEGLNEAKWIEPLDNDPDIATVLDKETRQELSDDIKGQTDLIKKILDNYYLNIADSKAVFPCNIQSHEGWLKIKKVQSEE